MGETWGIIRELLQVILLLATVPAQLAWPMLASGSGPRVLVGTSMLIAVYGGLLGGAAVARATANSAATPPAAPTIARLNITGHATFRMTRRATICFEGAPRCSTHSRSTALRDR